MHHIIDNAADYATLFFAVGFFVSTISGLTGKIYSLIRKFLGKGDDQ